MNPKDSIKIVLDSVNQGRDVGHNNALPRKFKVFKTVCKYLWYGILLAAGAYISIVIYG